MKILLSGYTYTRENLFEVFESYPEKENLYFILPSNWKEKRGKVTYQNFIKSGFNIYRSRAFFFHSNYPIIGGLFKGWMPFFVFRFAWLKLTKGVDILYTTGEPNLLGTFYNAVWAKIFGVKHIFNFWENIPYEQKDKGIKLFFKKLIIKANIALSDGALCGMTKAEFILRTFSKDITIGRFLHAGFNENRFRPNLEPILRKELGLENKFVLLFVGALGYRKGIHLVLDAVADLKNEFNNLHFIVIGSGEYEDSLKLKVKNLKLENMVTFIPWMDNKKLPEVFNSADVFVYPSIPHEGWEEQFGYSIAEASLCGLPVISTKTGGIDEVLINGKTGIAIDPDNVSELKNAMIRLITNRDLSKEYGQNGRQFIIDNYSNTIIAKKIYDLFKKVYIN
jgi:glycosyltransferase involved in cell wall biosynthesis